MRTSVEDALRNLVGLFGNPAVRHKLGPTYTALHEEAMREAKKLVEELDGQARRKLPSTTPLGTPLDPSKGV